MLPVRKLALSGFLAATTAWLMPYPSAAQDQNMLSDPATYVGRLRERGLISGVLQSQIQGIATALVATAGTWTGAQVNGPYDRSAVNIYLVQTKPVGTAHPQGLTNRALGTLLAFPSARLIIGDANYLAEVKAAADIYSESLRRRDDSVKVRDVLAIAMIEGPDRAERSRNGADADWRTGTNETFDGAAAFLLAHEMGHLALGLEPKLEDWISMPRGLTGPDRHRFWACVNLVSPNIEAIRHQEAEADLYAAKLLARIPHPSPTRRLRYEYGAVFLHLAEMGRVIATLAALSPTTQMLAQSLGRPIDPQVIIGMAPALGRDDQMIETVFPMSHPSQPDRTLNLYEVFAQTPMSAYYGSRTQQADRVIWQMLIQKTCSSIAPVR